MLFTSERYAEFLESADNVVFKRLSYETNGPS